MTATTLARLGTVKNTDQDKKLNRDMASDSVPIVRLVKVRKTYDGENVVVKDLTLDIEKGEFLTLLGPSGSGKTTTLMMLAGFETATEGEIFLNGRLINRLPPDKRGIGMVFQNYALFPHMTVAENLAFPLSVRGRSKADTAELVWRALDMVELRGFEDRRPAQLSGGQQQRIALARALIFQPDLVLMDEPLGALDKNLRVQMQYEIKHLHKRLGATIVYVTHDQAEALTMSDRVAVFSDGMIQQLSTPVELYERPLNSFVANFIGENNCLPGTVQAIAPDGLCRVVLDGGETVHAVAAEGRRRGERTLLSIRPERVVIDPDHEWPHQSVLTGRVEELLYHGDHIRARVSAAADHDFIVKVPNSALQPRVQERAAVRIGWRAEDCRALDAGQMFGGKQAKE